MEDNKINSLEEYIQQSLEGFDDLDFMEEKPPKPCFWKDIDSWEFPENPWLVKNLFPREGISIVASISGEGKSIMIMHLAQCISEGKPWFGNAEFETEQTRVLYINLEMKDAE